MSDLSKLGIREIEMLGDLLKAYAKNPGCLGEEVNWEFNPSSGNVFLVDEDCRVVLMNGDELEEFFTCGYCGHEGFKEDIRHESMSSDCQEFMDAIFLSEDERAMKEVLS